MYEIWSITCHTILYNEKFLLPRKSTFSKSTSETQCAVDHMLICFPAGICIFKINNENSRAMREIFSKLKLKAPEWQHSICYIIFLKSELFTTLSKIFSEEIVSWHVVLLALFWTLNRFFILFCCFHYWLWTGKHRLVSSYLFIYFWTSFKGAQNMYSKITHNGICI